MKIYKAYKFIGKLERCDCDCFGASKLVNGAGQFDEPKNYEYFGGLVKKESTYLIDMSFRGLF